MKKKKKKSLLIQGSERGMAEPSPPLGGENVYIFIYMLHIYIKMQHFCLSKTLRAELHNWARGAGGGGGI